jgi:hypothetical protein
MTRKTTPDRLFVRTIDGDTATVAALINNTAPDLVPHIVSMQQVETGNAAEWPNTVRTTVVFAIAPDGGYSEDKAWQVSYAWATQLIDKL